MKKIKESGLLFSVLLVTITIGVFAPIEFYITNSEEFWFSFSDVLRVTVFIASGGFVILMALGMLFRGVVRDIYSCILFAAGLALYIQGNYANIDYGILNGEAIDWGAYPVYAVLDTMAWILIIALSLFVWRRKNSAFCKARKYISIYIIGIEVVTLGFLCFTSDVIHQKKSSYYLSNEGLYEVSSDENIFIFVLDAFDDGYYQEIMKEDPEKYQNIFTDFVHYNNATVGGAHTKIGMPAILTGKHYEGEDTYEEFIKNAFNEDTLYSELKKENYDTCIYTTSTFVPDGSEELVDNQVSTGYSVSSYTGLGKTYLSLILYRYMPHVLKRYFWLYSGDFEQYKSGNTAAEYKVNDADYFNKLMEEGLSVKKGKKVFRLVHLNGPHPPLKLNEYAQVVDESETSSIQQAKAALYIVENYMEQLKKLGVYDLSTIIIMADHGSAYNVAHGILLVKEKNSKKPYAESAAPVSYFDLHSTLLSILNEKSDGSTFSDVGENVERERLFYLQDDSVSNIRIVEYRINGNINAVNQEETGIVYENAKKTPSKYQFGELLTFGMDGTAFEYVDNGLSRIDMENWSWTSDDECRFSFSLKTLARKDCMATIDIAAICDLLGGQRVIIYADDTECYSDTLTGGGSIQFTIPKEVLKDKELELKIELPDAVNPYKVTGTGDTRTLGLALCGFCMEEVDSD